MPSPRANLVPLPGTGDALLRSTSRETAAEPASAESRVPLEWHFSEGEVPGPRRRQHPDHALQHPGALHERDCRTLDRGMPRSPALGRIRQAFRITLIPSLEPPSHALTSTPDHRRVPCYQEPHLRLGSGSDGGSRKAGGPVRPSASSGETAAASRAVNTGRFHFSSTSLSTEVWSSTSLQT
jgi:hypothetical protein